MTASGIGSAAYDYSAYSATTSSNVKSEAHGEAEEILKRTLL